MNSLRDILCGKAAPPRHQGLRVQYHVQGPAALEANWFCLSVGFIDNSDCPTSCATLITYYHINIKKGIMNSVYFRCWLLETQTNRDGWRGVESQCHLIILIAFTLFQCCIPTGISDALHHLPYTLIITICQYYRVPREENKVGNGLSFLPEH